VLRRGPIVAFFFTADLIWPGNERNQQSLEEKKTQQFERSDLRSNRPCHSNEVDGKSDENNQHQLLPTIHLPI
jgi:hypothetical protein